MKLKCVVQPYAWGKVGDSSLVASLGLTGSHIDRVEPQSPYAELWMGSHPKGMATLPDGSSLQTYIKANPATVGSVVTERYGTTIPFLFKVLSVHKALSIQIHPNLKQAQKLHAERPDVYLDPNHKPEMAIALTPFEAMCGFRPLADIVFSCENVPELRSIMELEVTASYDSEAEKLKALYAKLMHSEMEAHMALRALIVRLSSLASRTEIEDLIIRLDKEFPNDVGCFSPYFLNYIKLQPGEALFLAANRPHAYLSGDCIECMACSDNVIRAGLTPKFKDVNMLVELLVYECQQPSEVFFKPKENGATVVYRPPVEDFMVTMVKGDASVDVTHSCAVILCVAGRGNVDGDVVQAGTVLFTPASSSKLAIQSTDSLVLYIAQGNM